MIKKIAKSLDYRNTLNFFNKPCKKISECKELLAPNGFKSIKFNTIDNVAFFKECFDGVYNTFNNISENTEFRKNVKYTFLNFFHENTFADKNYHVLNILRNVKRESDRIGVLAAFNMLSVLPIVENLLKTKHDKTSYTKSLKAINECIENDSLKNKGLNFLTSKADCALNEGDIRTILLLGKLATSVCLESLNNDSNTILKALNKNSSWKEYVNGNAVSIMYSLSKF